MTAQEWVQTFAQTAAGLAEVSWAKLLEPGIEPEARHRASTMYAVYHTISAELQGRLAEGFDDPAADHRARMVSACLDMAARYREAVQTLALLIPQMSPDYAVGYQVALGMMQVFAQVLESMTLATTPEGDAVLEQTLEGTRSGLRALGDAALLMRRGDTPVQ